MLIVPILILILANPCVTQTSLVVLAIGVGRGVNALSPTRSDRLLRDSDHRLLIIHALVDVALRDARASAAALMRRVGAPSSSCRRTPHRRKLLQAQNEQQRQLLGSSRKRLRHPP